MPALEILQHVGQLAVPPLRHRGQDAVDDMVGARLVGGVEIARFGRRFERAHDDARRIGAQIESLPVQKCGLRQGALGWSEWSAEIRRSRREARMEVAGVVTDAGELAHLGEAEKIGHHRFAARFSFARSGCRPSRQLPVSISTSGNRQIIAAEEPRESAVASAFHSGSPSARQAARQAEIVAVASTGC